MACTGQIILGRQVRDLPDGSAVLVYADAMAHLTKRPHSAQVVGHRGALRGALVESEWPLDDWHYLVLWVKGEEPETSPYAKIEQLSAELAKVKGYQAELAERCYRKDLELDELRG